MKKIAALAIAVGLCTPYSCDVRPVEFLWDDWQNVVAVGIPVLAGVAYCVLVFSPAFARLVERRGGTLDRLLAGLYAALLAFWTIACALDGTSSEQWLWLALAAGFTLGLLVLARRRGAPDARVPLLLLSLLGLPAVDYFLTCLIVLKSLQYGGWIFSAGYALAVIVEARGLRRAPSGGNAAPP
jgi:hypothetical protein